MPNVEQKYNKKLNLRGRSNRLKDSQQVRVLSFLSCAGLGAGSGLRTDRESESICHVNVKRQVNSKFNVLFQEPGQDGEGRTNLLGQFNTPLALYATVACVRVRVLTAN